jgi:hypothetical protein
MSAPDKERRLHSVAHVSRFGRSTFSADSSYDTETFKTLFFDDAGNPRQQTDYETIGRRAIAELLPPGAATTPARRLPLTDNATWKNMKDVGQFNFDTLFEPWHFSPSELGDIDSDYTVIIWWAESMHKTAVALRDLLEYLKSHPNWDSEDEDLRRFRETLDDCLADVENNARPQFSEPWGLLVMDMAAGGRSKKEARLCSPCISFSLP